MGAKKSYLELLLSLKNKHLFKIILSISFVFTHFIFYSYNCQAQWVQQTIPITSEASSLVFFDANTGIMVS